jgi:hypothetical protein
VVEGRQRRRHRGIQVRWRASTNSDTICSRRVLQLISSRCGHPTLPRARRGATAVIRSFELRSSFEMTEVLGIMSTELEKLSTNPASKVCSSTRTQGRLLELTELVLARRPTPDRALQQPKPPKLFERHHSGQAKRSTVRRYILRLKSCTISSWSSRLRFEATS